MVYSLGKMYGYELYLNKDVFINCTLLKMIPAFQNIVLEGKIKFVTFNI